MPCLPSRVLHLRQIPDNATEADVISLGLPFGKVTNVLILRGKSQVTIITVGLLMSFIALMLLVLHLTEMIAVISISFIAQNFHFFTVGKMSWYSFLFIHFLIT